MIHILKLILDCGISYSFIALIFLIFAISNTGFFFWVLLVLSWIFIFRSIINLRVARRRYRMKILKKELHIT